MIAKLLIANRGEIACRIVRSCRRLGIRTVAVFSEADYEARHVRMADEAVAIGPPPASESYLAIDRLLEAARRTGADAIHPGYGFLAERADFARAVRDAGLVFVGPPPEAMERLGAKDTAKAVAEIAGVPTVPGYWGVDQSDERLDAEARRIGFPLLIKACAGGGGRGMRRVDGPAGFRDALAACRREAAAAFGDDRVLLERLIERPRHVEVQVAADREGRVVHLFERDCTVQRRHQKIVEEAPAPGISEEIRRSLGDAAVRLAASAGYENAGTVEFLLDPDGRFYFIEMNTRLQVEHPVTEAVTGIDLVAWQIRIAEGRPLPCRQDELRVQGHAIEVRLYAEDPARGFVPSTGELVRLAFPCEGEGLRIETGVDKGDTVGPFYDPMIAKLVVHAEDRATALARLERALEATDIVGPTTNLGLLRAVLREPAFREATIDTSWIDRELGRLVSSEGTLEPFELVAAAFVFAATDRERDRATAGAWRTSPWILLDGFRLTGPPARTVRLDVDGRERAVRLEGPLDEPLAFVDETASGAFRFALAGDRLTIEQDGRLRRLRATILGDRVLLAHDGRQVTVRRAAETSRGEDESAGDAPVTAPMPGKIVRLVANPGDLVTRGQPVAVLEAMKMEHRVLAPRDGRVAAIHVAVGEQVEEGVILLDLVDPNASATA